MRSLVRCVVVVTALVVVGAAAARNGEPRRSISKADEARAKAVLLVRSDLGQGFVAIPNKPTPLPDEPRCDPLDESDLTITGDAASPDFRLQSSSSFVTVASTAQVYRSVAQANASWNRGTGADAAACLAALLRRSSRGGQKITVLSAKQVPFSRVTAKTTAYRLVAKVTVNGSAARVYIDAVVVQQGRIQAGIVLTSVGRPVARTEAAALASVVASRLAKAAGRPSGGVPGPSA